MGKINISMNNKVFYTLLAMMAVILIGIGVIAYGGSSPSVVGHSAGEVEGTISSGFCIFSDTQTSCPDGWTRNSAFDSRTIRGVSSGVGTTGGSDTHTHSAGSLAGPSHTHQWYDYIGTTTSSRSFNSGGGLITPWYAQQSANFGISGYGGQDLNQDLYTSNAGTGAVTGSTASASSWEPYTNVIVCCKD